ncbi:hypothetical protein QFC22_004939 [Naganishia vaughanmartiniae]|uniref:Uncharacterized protein n=1 Tax=Naganishia vaughanmartiniae TaxID=1424756 RepID=A0ACC2WXW3_9TREE|nr:hypothetical protein QFC22_004939 [Naganishia vaughanmartiniae]
MSSKRMAAFEKVRASKNPETPKGMLPLKDVITRWNSKEAAISRCLKLRATIESFTARANSTKCPRFPSKVFDALERIQPTLAIFLNLTQVYSKVGATSFRIIPDLVAAIDEIEEIHNHPSVSTARRKSSVGAVKKLQKYLNKFLKNPWVCMAYAFDQSVREEGLENCLAAYGMREHFGHVIRVLNGRVASNKELLNERHSEEEIEVQAVGEKKKADKFASKRFEVAGSQGLTHDRNDAWACYNSSDARYATIPGEFILSYWKRMSEEKELRPLAMLVREVLGLASSSASAERLFSHAGHVLGKKRGSLSARLLAKQTMLRMWEMQGLMTTADMRAWEAA